MAWWGISYRGRLEEWGTLPAYPEPDPHQVCRGQKTRQGGLEPCLYISSVSRSRYSSDFTSEKASKHPHHEHLLLLLRLPYIIVFPGCLYLAK